MPWIWWRGHIPFAENALHVITEPLHCFIEESWGLRTCPQVDKSMLFHHFFVSPVADESIQGVSSPFDARLPSLCRNIWLLDGTPSMQSTGLHVTYNCPRGRIGLSERKNFLRNVRRHELAVENAKDISLEQCISAEKWDGLVQHIASLYHPALKRHSLRFMWRLLGQLLGCSLPFAVLYDWQLMLIIEISSAKFLNIMTYEKMQPKIGMKFVKPRRIRFMWCHL